MQPMMTQALRSGWKAGATAGLMLALGLAAPADAEVLWSEDFSGINGQLQSDADWTGVEGLPNNRSLRNSLIGADDNPYGLGRPGAYAGNMFSGGGAVYTTLPTSDFYRMTGYLVDYATGRDQNNVTSLVIESDIDTTTHNLLRQGWVIRLEQHGPTDARVTTLRVDSPTEVAVIQVALGAAPTEVTTYGFAFERDGDQVTVSFFDEADARFVSATRTEAFNPAYVDLQLTRTVSDFKSDTGRFGWADLEMRVIPEPASLALLGVGGLLVTTRRRCAG